MPSPSRTDPGLERFTGGWATDCRTDLQSVRANTDGLQIRPTAAWSTPARTAPMNDFRISLQSDLLSTGNRDDLEYRGGFAEEIDWERQEAICPSDLILCSA